LDIQEESAKYEEYLTTLADDEFSKQKEVNSLEVKISGVTQEIKELQTKIERAKNQSSRLTFFV
jgi:predicted  nucleic acid-binding Zn-ribbon protein